MSTGDEIRAALHIDKLDESSRSMSIDDKVKALGQSQREFNRVSEGLLIYQSKSGDGEDLNCLAVDSAGNEIVCRHLSGNLVDKSKARAIKGYHDSYSSVAKIEQEEFLRENKYDASRVDVQSTYYRFFDYDALGENIQAIAKHLRPGEETRFMLDSENHSMALTIARKALDSESSHFVIKFYEPGKTDIHHRVVASDCKSIGSLSAQELFDSDDIVTYFPNFDTLTLFSPVVREDGDKALVEVDAVKDVPGCLYSCLICNVSEPIPKFCRLLQEKYGDDPLSFAGALSLADEAQKLALPRAFIAGCSESVKTYMEFILHAEIEEADKVRILKEPWLVDTASCPPQILPHYMETLKSYIRGVVNAPDLTVDAKKELLLAKGRTGKPFLYQELESNQVDTASIYLDAVIKSSLDEEVKVELLSSAKDKVRGFYSACKSGSVDTVLVYLDKVLQSDLSSDSKVKLISEKAGRYEAPGLFVAFRNSHYETAKAIVGRILSSSLEKEDKLTLLLAESDKGENGLYRALRQGGDVAANDFFKALSTAGLLDDFVARLSSSSEEKDVVTECIKAAKDFTSPEHSKSDESNQPNEIESPEKGDGVDHDDPSVNLHI